MNPNDLRWRLRNEIIQRIDMDAWVHCQTTEAAEWESLNKYIKAWPKAAAQCALRRASAAGVPNRAS
jgi:hypothetical protein